MHLHGNTLVQPIAAPVEALRRLAYRDPEAFPVLLDSAAAGPLGRYSILGAYPQGALWQDSDGRVQARGLAPPAPGVRFLQALEQAWRTHAESAGTRAGAAPGCTASGEGAAANDGSPPGPFRGGWLVFLGYELAAEIEPQLRLPAAAVDSVGGPGAFALRVPAAVVYDHVGRQAWLLAECGQEQLLEHLRVALVGLGPEAAASDDGASGSAWAGMELREEAPERFRAQVEAALEYIRAGDIYQANLSRAWRGERRSQSAAPSGASLYERLRASNPAPFAGFAHFDGWELLSSSPERLVRVAAGRVDTRPIAGTRPRSRIDGEDRREIEALIAHPKERAEHVMLIDLERNDLGRICRAGSVRADEFMQIESYAHVHHIVSNVCGELLPGLSPVQVLRAVFPGGTITGCPKFRCMQIIAELEGEARQAYTGALGFINHDGSMDFNILIRSLTLKGRQLELRAGAGIVADSDWLRELQETRAKARGLLAAFG